MPDSRVKWVAIAWAPHSRMSDTFARELGGKLYCVHYLKFKSPLHAPLKYVLQSLQTIRILFQERPDAVHVQNPPFVAGLVVSICCLFLRAQYVLHYHSAAFGRMWRWALPLQKWIARRAATNIVTNRYWAEIVAGWGGHTLIMVDPFLDLPDGEDYAVKPGFNVAFVNIFEPDEPVEAVVEAAALVPDVNFFITGDPSRKPAAFFKDIPPNVTFTGFLDPNGEYPGLLRAVDAVMVLTTRDHTLQLGGCESVALGKPLITSDWPYLREVFSRGAVFVSDEAESIRDGILAVRENRSVLAADIDRLRCESRQEWDSRLQELNARVASVSNHRGA